MKADGLYCTLDRPGGYVEVIYPTARGIIRDANGELREMTDEELEPLNETYLRHLRESFQ